jgi:ComF family protein
MSLVDFIFPRNCLGCGGADGYLCQVCVDKQKRAKQACLECRQPAIDGVTHARCKRPWGANGAFSIWSYQGVIRKILIKLKYEFALTIAEELAEHIYQFLKNEEVMFPSRTLLIPIPLHKKRQNWRGFNQVEEVGKLLCRKAGWQLAPNILIRKKFRQPQTGLKGKARKDNVRNIFILNSKYKSLIVDHRSLVVFDDVLTTGATIKEAAKVLKRNGAEKVWGLTITR